MATKKAPAPQTVLSRITLPLTVQLTKQEWDQASESFAASHVDLGAHAAHEEEVKKELKARRGEIEARIGRLALLVHMRRETRDVECEVIADHDLGQALTVRTDTGEVVAKRPLTHEERQLNLIDSEAAS